MPWVRLREVAGCGRTGVPIVEDLSSLMERGEVVVDFTTPPATLGHLRIVAQHRRGIVVGTTGFLLLNWRNSVA